MRARRYFKKHEYAGYSASKIPIFGRFIEYSTWLFERFKALLLVWRENHTIDFEGSLLFLLFSNFVDLLTCLTAFHQIAAVAAQIFPALVPMLLSELRNIDPKSALARLCAYFAHISSLFLVTLMTGGILTEIEATFPQLIRENASCDNPRLLSLVVGKFSDPRLTTFLRDDNPIMSIVYKFRPKLFQNSPRDVRMFDRLVLAAFSKQAGVLDELFALKAPVTGIMKDLVLELIRVRNQYRRLRQTDTSVDPLFSKALMLLRLNPSCRVPKLLATFVLHHSPPESIVAIFRRQRRRIQSTMQCFGFFMYLFRNLDLPLMTALVANSLSAVERFNGLASILESIELSSPQKKEIYRFLCLLRPVYDQTHDPQFLLILYRLLRDLRGVPGLAECRAIPVDMRPSSPAEFCEMFCRVEAFQLQIPEKEWSVETWVLFSECLRTNMCTENIFQGIASELFARRDISRFICRALYHALASPELSDASVRSFLLRAHSELDTSFRRLCQMDFATSLVWLFRRIIRDQHSRRNQVIKSIVEANERPLAGFAILGFLSEPVRPYALVRYRGSCFVTTPSKDSKMVDCYELPLDLRRPPLSLQACDPELSACSLVELNSDSYLNYDYIFSFIRRDFPAAIRLMYAQLLAKFCEFSAFAARFCTEGSAYFAEELVSFESIPITISRLYAISLKTNRAPSTDSFFSLKGARGRRTYFSPLLCRSAKLRVPTSSEWIGVVAVAADPCDQRYQLIKNPEGRVFPQCGFPEAPLPSSAIRMLENTIPITIDCEKRRFTVAGRSLAFPAGNLFRLVVGTKAAFNPIVPDFAVFDESQPIIINPPEWEPQSCMIDVSSSDDELKFTVREEAIDRLLTFHHPDPPIPLHVDSASKASWPLLDFQVRLLVDRLARQFLTVAMIRVTAAFPAFRENSLSLFRILVLALEVFDLETRRCPMDRPVWDETYPRKSLYLGLETEVLMACRAIVRLPELASEVSSRISFFASQVRCHFSVIPNGFIRTYSHNWSKTGGWFVPFNHQSRVSGSLVPCLSWTNEPFKDTGMELVILLKHLSFMARGSSDRNRFVMTLIDLYVVKSPMARRFLRALLALARKRCGIRLADDPLYETRLAMLKNVDDHCDQLSRSFRDLRDREAGLLVRGEAAELCMHFPEFFEEGLLCRPSSRLIARPPWPDITVDLLERLTTHHESISYYPFWELFPFWLTFMPSPPSPESSTLETDGDYRVLRNPGRTSLSVRFQCSYSDRDSMILVAPTRDFEEPIFISGAELRSVLSVSDRETYFSIIGFPHGWGDVRIIIPETRAHDPHVVNTAEIHDAFIADVTAMATVWSRADDQALLEVLTPESLTNGSFTDAHALASGSALIGRFSQTVVVLRAFLIYQVARMADRPSTNLGPHLSSLLPADWFGPLWLHQMQQDSNDIRIEIDRGRARRFAGSRSGNVFDSIIGQLCIRFEHFPHAFRGKERPWIVHFVGEEAIDVGGPGRELITDTAASIFHLATNLVTATGNGFFVPFGSVEKRLYWAVGFFIAIVIRTRLVQDLPFVPLVWKYLAGETITSNDIREADPELSRALDQVSPGCQWVCRHWDGEEVAIPGRSSDAIVSEDRIGIYVQSVLAFRQQALIPALTAMKEGFEKNAGTDRSHPMDGRMLSALAQGTSSVSVLDLQRIAQYERTEPAMERLWRVLERFSDEQRRLFLKFVTGQSRLPGPGFQGDFKLKIQKSGDGDGRLPTAATCFQSLQWPGYSNDEIAAAKLDFAIRNCQTMENA
jgi:hypothetical protein